MATTFLVLKQNALEMVDHPITDASALTKMGIFINQTLQEIYALDQGRRLVQDTTTIATVAAQEYVEFATATPVVTATATPDEILNVYQTEDDIQLVRWSMDQYREFFPDVTNANGNPTHYARWRDRLYLYPRPDSAINLLLDIWVYPVALSADGDTPLLEIKYDEWILMGAAFRWMRLIDPDDSTKIGTFKALYDDLTRKYGEDLNREPSRKPVLRSHSDSGVNSRTRDFVSPVPSP